MCKNVRDLFFPHIFENKIGSTLKGIGPAYMDKTGRNGLRVGDISAANFKERYEKLKQKHIQILNFYDFEYECSQLEENWFASLDTIRKFEHIESEHYLHKAIKEGKNNLAEGAQGTLAENYGLESHKRRETEEPAPPRY